LTKVPLPLERQWIELLDEATADYHAGIGGIR